MHKKILFSFLAVFCVCTLSLRDASAACSDTPLQFQSVVALDFDTIEGTAGTGNVTLGSNGTVTYGAGYTGAGLG
jgi:hypothetical protein